MSPEAVTAPEALTASLFGADVSWWLILAHAGFILGAAIAAARSASAWRRMLACIGAAYVGAVVGARGFSVLFDGSWDVYAADPSRVFDPRGGFVLYGGVAGGLAAGLAAARALGLRLGTALDAAAPGIAIGVAVGRIGCFVAGCCWGCETTSHLGIAYHNFAQAVRPIGVPMHPTQLYECAGLVAIAIGVWRWQRARAPQPGAVFAVTAVAYAVLRFGIELLRADPRGAIAGLPTSQTLSIVVACAALAWLAVTHRPRLRPLRPLRSR